MFVSLQPSNKKNENGDINILFLPICEEQISRFISENGCQGFVTLDLQAAHV